MKMAYVLLVLMVASLKMTAQPKLVDETMKGAGLVSLIMS